MLPACIFVMRAIASPLCCAHRGRRVRFIQFHTQTSNIQPQMHGSTGAHARKTQASEHTRVLYFSALARKRTRGARAFAVCLFGVCVCVISLSLYLRTPPVRTADHSYRTAPFVCVLFAIPRARRVSNFPEISIKNLVPIFSTFSFVSFSFFVPCLKKEEKRLFIYGF